MSSDKISRKEGIDWWKEEVPNYSDMENCLTNLSRYQNKVNFIVAHTCPNSIAQRLVQYDIGSFNVRNIDEDQTTKMLEHIVSICEFEKFFCGHWHVNKTIDRYNFLYHAIVKIF